MLTSVYLLAADEIWPKNVTAKIPRTIQKSGPRVNLRKPAAELLGDLFFDEFLEGFFGPTFFFGLLMRIHALLIRR